MPALASIAIGDKQQFTATGKYADDSTKDITESVTWTSEKDATATVSNDDGSKGLATAVAPGPVMITAKTQGRMDWQRGSPWAHRRFPLLLVPSLGKAH